MTTLFDLLYYTYRGLHVTREGTATGGSATTVIDTTRLADFEDDYWNGGTVGILHDAVGAGADPEGRYAIITDFDKLTSTITMSTVTGLVAVGDQYFVTDDTFPLYDVLGFINKNLADTEYPTWDESIETAAAQTEYTLPIAAKRAAQTGKLRVWLEQVKTDADDQRWVEIVGWRSESSGGAAATDELILPYQYDAGYAVGLEYMQPHTLLWAYNDDLEEAVPWENVVYPTILDLLSWRKSQFDWQDYIEETTVAVGETGEFITEYRVNWEKQKADQLRYNDLIVKYKKLVEERGYAVPLELPKTVRDKRQSIVRKRRKLDIPIGTRKA